MMRRKYLQSGFALPTVLIASVVLLTVLAVSVTATTASRNALQEQYYTQLARLAAESGAAFARACLADNGDTVTWSDGTPLTPTTDCAGTDLASAGTVAALVVAGGGGGGSNGGGGGGAGGYLYNASLGVSATSYSVTVGTGGAASTGNTVPGTNGSNSVFSSLTATGGGGGASRDGGTAGAAGGSGGGGGGGGSGRTAAGIGTGGQGSDGGIGVNSSCSSAGGGGGGAGGLGGNASTTSGGTGGDGGVGLQSAISGSSVWYAVGAPGGRTCSPGTPGAGATGGGSSGSATPANTGGGGAGGSGSAVIAPQAGADGIVIIAYPTGTLTATGGTVTTSGGNTIHTFTSSGTFTVSAVTGGCSGTECTLVQSSTMRSSFTVGEPVVDNSGDIISIPTTGLVELLRESDGSVWRTFEQPTFEPLSS